MADLNSLPSPTDSPEPAIYGTLLSAILSLAVSLGLHLSADQVVALSTIVTLLSGLVIRHHVRPVVSSAVATAPPV